MKRMKALKHIYVEGNMIMVGEYYMVDDIVAARHVRTGKGAYAPHPFTRTVGEDRNQKVVGPEQTKGKKHVSKSAKASAAG